MKIICIGRNYADHIEELENERPKEPVVFLKPDTTIGQRNTPFYIPDFSSDVHHEIEIIVKINRIGKHIQEQFAHKYYDQISVGIDFTARDLQTQLKAKGLPWEKAKAFDGAAVLGQWLPKKEFKDLQNLNFELTKNDASVQRGHTRLMLYTIDQLIAYVSQFFTLKIGDILFTGTPAGVGAVQENDRLEGFLEGQKLLDLKIK
ncbi:MAG: fumarylacetoacetate hydrolase family protein [Flavobacteriales bacterium]|jgi:2-keto-4-pentenoate hydratase/2-oxohepta-3-ene-1,7-dioic acid hydratase in catechol pathway|nr:fumarylacetoacetate hydrolase family protein [Flavobacteriales bacterium]MBT7656330.1 fumarylacetoacetate hydrolase family protein [Flavobacteriales bacterium]MDG1271297.1 fumarylacetoacetate hydrolase family protein [Flavobacteriaceae bacterium]